MFSRQLHLGQRRLLGAHDYSNRSTSMEHVKHLFAEKIKQSSHFLTNPGCSNPVTTNEKGVTSTSTLMPLKEKGWAIPKWKKFRYSEKQKRIVMQYFEEGEQTGIKRTTE